ncbi:MAG: radical SAM protein [Pseudomonadota bacterium]
MRTTPERSLTVVPEQEAVVFSPSKVGVDPERIKAYLRGERIYPLTMELDLTQRCTRTCPSCPYGVERRPGLTLQLPFLDRLFGILGPHVPGLVLSGGEPTSVPHFPETVALARKAGVQEIAVITNGSCLHDARVQEALLGGVTSVRVSLYDWQEGESEYFNRTLRLIELLRKRADMEGSPLEIAAAMLTRREWTHRFDAIGRKALDAGVHWLYFHPFCVEWETGYPGQADQTGVMGAIQTLKDHVSRPGAIQVPFERYEVRPLTFSRLHGAHFLIQVGADGINYAGPECKYSPDYALLDLNEYLEDDFLWYPDRLGKIEAINSDGYAPIKTRHRPPIFSDYIERSPAPEPGFEGSAPAGKLSFRQRCII